MIWARRTFLRTLALLGGSAALGDGITRAAAQTPAPMPPMPGMNMGAGMPMGGEAPPPAKAPAVVTRPTPTARPPRPVPGAPGLDRRGVITLNGHSLEPVLKGGVKEFHLTAEAFDQEFAPGFTVRVWGYNGSSPGPTIEAVEGDRIRILVTNRLPEATSIHWHGMLLPSGMDGVAGLSAPAIPPGETWAYEFTLRQHGTVMYHPHADEMVQMAMGMMGMVIIHPREPEAEPVDRDYAMMLHAWAIRPGTYRPDPAVMLDQDIWTINGRVFPAVEQMVVKTGERVRLRLANLSMHEHPMHIHGHHVRLTGTDGGPIPPGAQVPMATVQVPVGSTRDVIFIADNPGDWAFHCHKTHHAMNAMSHDLPNRIGAAEDGRVAALVPGYMAMGGGGMGEMEGMAGMMPGPENTLPMMGGRGPYGPLGMGGMVTVLKVRDTLAPDYRDPGWYKAPPGTLAWKVE